MGYIKFGGVLCILSIKILSGGLPDPYFDDSLYSVLQKVDEINAKTKDRLPLILNTWLQGGYFSMPSARMASAGTASLGYSYLPPYKIWNGAFQLFSHLEITASYNVFHNQLEYNFGKEGFGDDADRIANVKLALLQKQDGLPLFPEIAIGINDFIGTKRFHSFYIVATQELLKEQCELSLGWGSGRIQGFFGGLSFTPFHHSSNALKNFSLVCEYDANNYAKHSTEHAEGKTVKSPFNLGVQARFFENILRVSLHSQRGSELSGMTSLSYNFGESRGFFPKLQDPLLYSAPIDHEPISPLRKEKAMAAQFGYAFQEQGLDLYKMILDSKPSKKILWMKIINDRYREEKNFKRRIVEVLAAILPSDIDEVRVELEINGILTQEYRFSKTDLQNFFEKKISLYEFNILSPLLEASSPQESEGILLYERRKKIWSLMARPMVHNYFGSRKGKLKFDGGVIARVNGYLFNEIYYDLGLDYIITSTGKKIGDRDFYNPSQLLNVRTDLVRYIQPNSIHLEKGYFQKGWNLGRGWFGRIALGYFELAYAGLALEALYYPVNSSLAIGFQCAPLLKRNYQGLGFQRKIRKFQGTIAEYVPYFGLQYFVDFYYSYRPLDIDVKVSVGQFLARDKGARFEVTKYFASGLRVSVWTTLTNAVDIVNGKRYFDKGFCFSLPLELFLQKSSRSRVKYGMSAWLRDVGAVAATGKKLYPTIFYDRINDPPHATR